MIDAVSYQLEVPGSQLSAGVKYFGQTTEEFYIPFRAADPSGVGAPSAQLWLMNIERSNLPASVRVGVRYESFNKTTNQWVNNGDLQSDQEGFIGAAAAVNIGLNRVRSFTVSDADVDASLGGAIVRIIIVPMGEHE